MVGVVGRNRFRARLAQLFLYLILSIGAITTVYPFLVMISTGLKSAVDQNDDLLIPSYFVNNSALFARYQYEKYAGNLDEIASRSSGKATAGQIGLYREFLMQLPLTDWQAGFRTSPVDVTSRLSMRYQQWLRQRFATIQEVNRAYTEEGLSFQSIQPPSEAYARLNWEPIGGRKWQEFQGFKSDLPAEYRIPVTLRGIYQAYLRAKYQGNFHLVPAGIAGGASGFNSVQLPAVSSAQYAEFLRVGVPARYRQENADTLWARFLSSHQVSAFPMPQEGLDRADVTTHASSLRKDFAARNFVYVWDYLAVNGGAFWNTFVYCGLAILFTLVVNTIAAYALSRFPVRQSARILIFLLATMAFPAEVALIPNFLLLKQLHLLNTFAALVLPGIASGYMVFLLKGFFDSLPTELFEAGAMDGAKELLMLWKVALPLSLPVLGYFALIVFLGAYGNFIYAFLVAQDHRIWTVMVYLYQLSEVAPKYVMMAAFTFAAIPTMLIFLLAQKTILRGIVLPDDR